MELKRKPFQGVLNIIRFNWHFYVITTLILVSIILLRRFLPAQNQQYVIWLVSFAVLPIIVSIIISFYIYDISNLYQLPWIKNLDKKNILTVNAGFDETSSIIERKITEGKLTICDFYDPLKHIEISIKRARRVYPPLQKTIKISTKELPFSDNSFDICLAILSAHEVRDENERIQFFKELNRVTKSNGQVFVTEHLRDLTNFIAYTVGFFHFHSNSTWLRTFKKANFEVKQKIKTTPFITTFKLSKNGNPL